MLRPSLALVLALVLHRHGAAPLATPHPATRAKCQRPVAGKLTAVTAAAEDSSRGETNVGVLVVLIIYGNAGDSSVVR